MKNTIRNFVRITFAVIALSFILASCKKENDTSSPLSLKNAKATVSPAADTLVGNWGNPIPPTGGPATYGTVYANLVTGAQSASSSGFTHHLFFNSYNNSVINPATGYSLRYLNTTTALSSISLSDYTNAVPVTSLGESSTTDPANADLNATGWYTYQPEGDIAVVENLIIFVRNNSTGVTYAVQFTDAEGQGVAVNNRGVYWFNRGQVL